MENRCLPKKVPGFCSFRYGLAILLHFCNIVIMAQRVCLNLTMVAMVNKTEPPHLSNKSVAEMLDNVKNPVHSWSLDIQGLILSSVFLGMVVIQVPVGYLSGAYPMKKIIGSSLFLSSVLSLLIPPAAQVGAALVIVCRVLQGIAQGAVSTGQHGIWVKWAPPLERGRLTSMTLSGFVMGPFIALLVSGFICDLLGWPMVFYIFGIVGCVLSLFWFILFFDDPNNHPYMSSSEKDYITSSLMQQVHSGRQSLPIKAMLKSLPLWAIILNSFAFIWSNNLLVTYTPTFISTTLHVNVRENGLLSSLPYLLAYICGIVAGQMSDFLLSRKIFSVVAVRKLFTTLGIFCPVIFVVCLLYLSYNFYSTVIFLTLANSTLSFSFCGQLINALDIAPRYYGFLKAVTALIGIFGGLISSTLAGLILNQDPEYAWHKNFFLMAGINVTCLAFYLLFAKGDIQDWAKETKTTRL
ncbi:solute carrier family 17 (sodium phosphate), member 1, isoform CRA_d [Rattus norvegicus]|uniref:Solute carrier family 17 (Sodium phosphate), member 1 n=3 Tax=Rattus norvegicus TaxID=10116 RepID=A0A9K3Y819_RAT|nr:sodium-dependent phosphate transport protein 1 [Rattus norvegicus]XP_032740408.1 sodium-dependent phosphate transport protein 1 [Rattus rattus]XP_038951246.1 sodium-dependent phosphate transport protein 1 isoform X1 [Rattus norvegicus]AAH78748.1 Solute carrier family 17 (sodium phosphate), member 1 [Rattus norvegicus]EDL86540.1 solute carrier family 17 (sodium phosphate), member 1, isoform CRA_d [Rattus norvegicus]EDL86541.1 solute carrier family 17 (sodium phosphate), member 1, isoform CRA|eukprot:NP_598238.2 sodium-dependent phosphate transport protein 1 [Rattus norvegicus]